MPLPGKQGAPFRSSLARRITERPLRFRIFPVSGFFGVAGRTVEYVGILYGLGKDGAFAQLAAHASVGRAVDTRKTTSSARADVDLLAGAKLDELLFRLCRAVDPARPDRLKTTQDGLHTYPAFPSPDWITASLGPDQIAALMALVVEVRQEHAPRRGRDTGEDGAGEEPQPFGFEDEDVDRLAGELAAVELAEGAAAAGGELAHLPRAAAVRLCVRLSQRLVAAQRARDALLAGAAVAAAPVEAPAG
jgi:hypothetical protein